VRGYAAPVPGLAVVHVDRPAAVIGDVHGRADLLERLLAELGNRAVFSVGDVVDRGPEVPRCVDLLVARGAVGVIGNHEEWVQRWLSGEGFDRFALHPAMGGEATLRGYGIGGRGVGEVTEQRFRVPPAHHAWFAGLVDGVDLTVMGRRFWVVHAAPDLTDLDGGEEEARAVLTIEARRLRWGRYEVDRVPDCGRPVIAGHMTRPEPEQTTRCIAIDTGCGTVPGGALTAVLLPERRFVTVR